MGLSSSINLGISNTPDTTNLSNDPIKMQSLIIGIYNALHTLQYAVDSYTGNTPTPDPTSFDITDPGASVTLAKQSCVYYVASGAIDEGKLCCINSDKTASHADNSVGTKFGRGIALNTAADGTNVQICVLGAINIYATGTFTPGGIYYMGAAGLLLSAPGLTGTYSQAIGFALSDTEIFINPDLVATVVP